MLSLEHSAILLTWISDNCLENQFSVVLRVDVLHRFYCIKTKLKYDPEDCFKSADPDRMWVLQDPICT